MVLKEAVAADRREVGAMNMDIAEFGRAVSSGSRPLPAR
jgi:hypothetical protein